MSTFWTTGGKIIKDALGKIVLCASCPCSSSVPCTDCGNVSQDDVIITGGSNCGTCTSINPAGTYTYSSFNIISNACTWNWTYTDVSESIDYVLGVKYYRSPHARAGEWDLLLLESGLDAEWVGENVSGISCLTGGQIKIANINVANSAERCLGPDVDPPTCDSVTASK